MNLEQRRLKAVKDALAVLEEHGYEARMAGGCVRDRLLAIEPKDFDVATTALPEEVTTIFTSDEYRVIPTGIEHGTVTLVLPTGPVEITTLRDDIETDGRRAVVHFGKSFEEDAARRDFTINAMFEDRHGQIYDFFGGQKHLQEKLLYFVGDPKKRIEEDFLRILRFFRFKARFNLKTDEAVLSAIAEKKEGLDRISQERITNEVIGMFKSDRVERSLKAMHQTGVLEQILPEIKGKLSGSFGQLDDCQSLPVKFRAVARLAMLFLDEGHGILDKPALEAFSLRMRLSNEQSRKLEVAVFGYDELLRCASERADRFAFIDHVEKHAGHETFLGFYLPFWSLLAGRLKGQKMNQSLEVLKQFRILEEGEGHLRRTAMPVTGKVLMEALSLAPGPRVGEMMEALQRSFRNGQWKSKEEGLAFARRLLD